MSDEVHEYKASSLQPENTRNVAETTVNGTKIPTQNHKLSICCLNHTLMSNAFINAEPLYMAIAFEYFQIVYCVPYFKGYICYKKVLKTKITQQKKIILNPVRHLKYLHGNSHTCVPNVFEIVASISQKV